MQKTINEKMGLHVEVIPSPFFIETEQLDDSIYHQQIAGKPYILFFSSYLSALKGSFVLAEALPKVLPFHPELNVVVVGNNLPHDRERGILSSRQYFKDLCGPYSDQVIFLDALPHSNLYPIIIGARLVVLPSLADNLSNACLEAMGLGKVVVGSNGRSFDELIDDGRSGFLAEPGDADDLSRAIRNALENADLETMGSAVKERIAQQDPDVVIPQLLAYYHKVISGYKKQFNSI